MNTSIRYWFLATVAAIVAVAPAARGGSAVYVSTNATPASPYDSWGNAFTNVQEALDFAASSGGTTNTILLAGHTFWLTNQIAWTTAGLTVCGGYEADPGGASPGTHNPEAFPSVLARSGVGGNHRIMFIDGADNSTLEHVTLTGGYLTSGTSGTALYILNSQGVVLSGCRIENNHHAQNVNGTLLPSAIRATSSGVILTNCIVRANSGVNTRASGGHAHGGALYVDNSTLVARDSRIVNNFLNVGASARTRGGGVYVDGGSLDMRNVLLVGNRGAGTTAFEGEGLYVAAGTVNMRHCTVTFNGMEGIRRSGGSIDLVDSIVWNHLTANMVGDSITADYSNIGDENYADYGANNNNADPLFEYGFYLADGSPCIGTGSDTAASAELAAYTTRTDGAPYADPGDTVSRGWHYSPGTVFDLTYTNIYVSPDGDDANIGTQASEPFETLTKAFSVARDGSRIHVAAGHYGVDTTETYPLVIDELIGVEIMGTNTAATIVDAGLSGARVLTLAYAHLARVQGLTLTGGQDVLGGDDCQGNGIHIQQSQYITLADVNITDNVYDGTGRRLRGGGLYAGVSSVVMTNCLVAGNEIRHGGGGAGDLSQGAGIWSDGILTMIDCVIRDNIAESRDNRRTSDGGGIYSSGPHLTLRNVLISGNETVLRPSTPANSRGAGIFIGIGTADMRHCTVADNAGEGLRRLNGTVTITDGILWGNWTNIVGASVTANHSTIGDANYDTYGANNSGADPLFEFGYYLADGSPGSGTGSDTAANLGMLGYVRNAGGATYGAEDTVNRGYHYRTGLAMDYPDLYVATDGDDVLNSGTIPEEPFKTMTHALSLAHAGTRIHVATGTYSITTTGEQFPLNVTDLPDIQILGAASGHTIFNAANAGTRVMDIERSARAQVVNLTLTGADITDPDAPNNQGAGLRILNSQDVVLSGCVISNNVYRGSNVSAYGGGIYASASTLTAKNCRISDNLLARTGSGASSQTRGGGIWSDGILVVRDSEIMDNTGAGPDRNSNQGGGIYFTGIEATMKNVLIANNEATGTTSGHGDGLHIEYGDIELVNCTVVDNKGEGIRRVRDNTTLLNTIVWSNGEDLVGAIEAAYSLYGTGPAVIDGGNNIVDNPMFVDPGAGDYRLLKGSPAIDAGLNQDWMVGAVDLAGLSRILMSRVDMGCYEAMPPRGTLFMFR